MTATVRRPLVPEDLHRSDYRAATRRSLIRSFAATTLASLRGQRNPADLLTEAWPDDHVAEILLKAATAPTSSSSFPAAEGLAGLVLLAPSSAALRLFETQLRLTLGQNATVRVPSVATPPVAVFVPELSPGPVLQGVLGAASLGPTKKILILAAIT